MPNTSYKEQAHPRPFSGQAFATIHDDQYVTAREALPLGHPHYPHLADLWQGLAEVTAHVQGCWLDYGAGGSPYRSLFTGCDYQRADVQGEGLDYLLIPGRPLPAPTASFDGILSTQVLEHVQQPQRYLEDCYRLLRPGGTLLLTTHGVWKEHGTPYDYHRWTTFGLQTELEAAGFQVQRQARLTCGPRAVLMLLNSPKFRSGFSGQGLLGRSLDFCFRWIVRHKKAVYRLSDRVHSHLRVVWDRPESFYLALLVEAHKP